MLKIIDKAIALTFSLLLFLVPLVFFPHTSELFEFNKIIVTYSLGVIAVFLWLVKMIMLKKIVFRRTFFDLPLIIFLTSQALSTLISIDTRTSLLGYYSRFHGGLTSSLSYALLYWVYVSNMNFNAILKNIRLLLASAFIICIWGILEHFGRSFSCLIIPEFRTFDTSCWVQDVQNRVYATLGQPNWLAAWLVALIPLTWGLSLLSKNHPADGQAKKSDSRTWNTNFFLYTGLSALFFLTLLYTKSRSGILAFGVAFGVFWLTYIFLTTYAKIRTSFLKKDELAVFIITALTTVLTAFLAGTPWTLNLSQITSKDRLPTASQQQVTNDQSQSTFQAPALETGGTESGTIRKIVWKGAIDIWKNYPILGSGVETFAFAYYKFRPAEHNLVSEWDFLYNKAHNEYLNFAATTGSIGLGSYLFFIFAFLLVIVNKTKKVRSGKFDKNIKDQRLRALSLNNKYSSLTLDISLMAGFTSILVTNFFGFSVVPVALLFFLYPGMAGISTLADQQQEISSIKLTSVQKLAISIFLLFSCYLLIVISRYWYADFLYAKGKLQNDAGNPSAARELILKAIRLSAREAFYWDELANSSVDISLGLAEQKEEEVSKKLAISAINESKTALNLSPANVNLRRNRASVLVKLSVFEPDYLVMAKNTLEEATELAPTDAKLFYNLAIAYLRLGDYERAIQTMEKTINLKPNYRDARFALSLLYIDKGQKEKARLNLEYILDKINPNDDMSKRELEELE